MQEGWYEHQTQDQYVEKHGGGQAHAELGEADTSSSPGTETKTMRLAPARDRAALLKDSREGAQVVVTPARTTDVLRSQ